MLISWISSLLAALSLPGMDSIRGQQRTLDDEEPWGAAVTPAADHHGVSNMSVEARAPRDIDNLHHLNSFNNGI